MVSPLVSSLAKTMGSGLSGICLDAVLTRDVPGTIVDPADPPPPTQTTFACKGIEQEYGTLDRANGLVDERDIQVLILASTLATDPKSGDRITIRGKTVSVVPGSSTGGIPPVQSDPARATWLCRCKT
jgi:hypothetical protein